MTMMMCGNRMVPVEIETTKDYHYIATPFALKDEIKVMQGARWMGYDPINPRKVWRVNNSRRNNFNLDYLMGKKPFEKYVKDIDNIEVNPEVKDWKGNIVKMYSHQIEITKHILARRQCEIAGEMGVGKTLAAFKAIQISLVPETWWIAPKSALSSVRLEASKWGITSKIRYMTYDELKRVLADWKDGEAPPKFVVYDEASRVKTPSSQRSQAAMHLAESMRNAYGDDAYIVLMSGSPAPKSPLDWYWQCEIACPGFIREGDIHKFQQRLAVLNRVEDMTGTSYNKLIRWRDGNTNFCNVCGLSKDEHVNIFEHNFMPLVNEVEKLYKRLKGLVCVKFKKDCLDLPDKIYRIIKLKPSLDLLRAARLVSAGCKSAIEQLTRMRELSDGFQYQDDITSEKDCKVCQGRTYNFNPQTGLSEPCQACSESGKTPNIERKIVEVSSPKIDALNDLLEENDDIGRIVIYAGFTASIDRVCRHVEKQGWKFIRVDGRGWTNNINPNWDDLRCLQEFQKVNDSPHDKIAFVGHPGSAGMGLTLTAASMILYFSNDFNAESRIQSEDRIHRVGMDANRGATIVDFVLLPTDEKVLDNLKRKRELQSLSLGELQSAINNYREA